MHFKRAINEVSRTVPVFQELDSIKIAKEAAKQIVKKFGGKVGKSDGRGNFIMVKKTNKGEDIEIQAIKGYKGITVVVRKGDKVITDKSVSGLDAKKELQFNVDKLISTLEL